ncbi:hypothetical protein TNCT_107261 [Trichonephila clavata]|uniref:Uncharacterized protein n=1 Tax=Trichonephila clavata TaxID=2740835 RepID=A0A8X6LDN4_TRICU|nr:hypothetical protein TNCT_107261 [Trichonephila clavata]
MENSTPTPEYISRIKESEGGFMGSHYREEVNLQIAFSPLPSPAGNSCCHHPFPNGCHQDNGMCPSKNSSCLLCLREGTAGKRGKKEYILNE